ncbi:MAG TPA: formylglycine-generating enzyme family protein [bacterium]|nr:formylglycine-generating enzyme family protein [bacterium]
MNRFLTVILAFAALLFAVSCGGHGGPDDIGGMVDVPAGEFQMGCNSAVDDQCRGNESPYHAVTLSTYKIGKYEVTVGEYQKCVANGACNNSNENEPHYWTNTDDSYCNLGATGKENHPMQCVTWYGAKAYCEYIGQRLPTEAEWEKAARGTDGRKYPWGNETATCDYAVMHDDNADGDGCGSGGTMPIGSKEAGKSPYGAYDMAGNVWEWVNDWYGETYYETTPTNNPAGPDSGDSRVLRGGSWGLNYDYGHLRASFRSPALSPAVNSLDHGFRCAK